MVDMKFQAPKTNIEKRFCDSGKLIRLLEGFGNWDFGFEDYLEFGDRNLGFEAVHLAH
jgi:hypothetical protein